MNGIMTTIHSYTNDQADPGPAAQGPAARPRRGGVHDSHIHRCREGHLPLVIPELKGKLDGVAIRVPTPNVSVVDLMVFVEKKADRRRRSTPR